MSDELKELLEIVAELDSRELLVGTVPYKWLAETARKLLKENSNNE